MKISTTSIFFIIILLGGEVLAQPQTIHEAFDTANEDYLKNRFTEAGEGYQKLLSRPVVSGDLLYNLGNVYYQEGAIGKAILYYERALRIMPRDHDLRANIQYVKNKRINPVEDVFFWERLVMTLAPWIGFLTLNEMLWILGLIFGGVWCLGWLYLVVSKIPLKNFSVILACVTAVMAASLGFKYYLENISWGVVLKPSVEVGSTFVDPSKSLMTLYEGSKVRIIARQNFNRGESWVQTRLINGQRGWIRESDIEEI